MYVLKLVRIKFSKVLAKEVKCDDYVSEFHDGPWCINLEIDKCIVPIGMYTAIESSKFTDPLA